MRIFALLLSVLAIAVCAQAAHAQRAEPDLNPLAERYVRLQLEIGTHEERYIDAYFGPPEWRTKAEAHPRPIAELKAAVDALRAQIDTAGAQARDELVRRRAHMLSASLASARTRLSMMEGVRESFVDEAEHLFALRPELVPLAHYDAVLRRLEQIAPGQGSLSERIAAFTNRIVVPADRREAVVRAAIAECRRRTAQHIQLPANERFDLEFVSDKPWGAYNWYQGNNHSLIQINTDQPLRIGSAILWGCHEGYPGHHLQGIHAEKLYRERGWVEYSVMPLYSPLQALAEGGANYGVTLAFPGNERLAFERDILFPLAGLDPALAQVYDEMRTATNTLNGAVRTITAQYIDGTINRERAIELLQLYTMSTRSRAEQNLQFADQTRSYVITYSSGQDVVRAYAERAGADPAARWAAYLRIFEEPTLPSDLVH